MAPRAMLESTVNLSKEAWAAGDGRRLQELARWLDGWSRSPWLKVRDRPYYWNLDWGRRRYTLRPGGSVDWDG